MENTTQESKIPIAIFWDFENCPPPRGSKGAPIINSLREVLRPFGWIRQINAYGELRLIPERLRTELQRAGVHMIDVHSNRKDAVDKMIISDMLLFAVDNQPPQVILLISGDQDYTYPLAKLRLRSYDIILVIPPVGAHPTLKDQADRIIEWYDLTRETLPEGIPSRDAREALKFEPLLSILELLRKEGKDDPTLADIGKLLSKKYPARWQRLGKNKLNNYVEEAARAGLVEWQKDGDYPFLKLLKPREEIVEAEETLISEESRFSPLIIVLQKAREEGIKGFVLYSWVGSQLRAMIPNWQEQLGVHQLKDYIQEGEEANIVMTLHEGLNHYVALTTGEKRVMAYMKGDKDLNLLEQALDDLQEELIIPYEKNIINRMKEIAKGEFDIQKTTFKTYDALLAAAQEQREISVEGAEPYRKLFRDGQRYAGIDPNDCSKDPFPEDQWLALLNFFTSNMDSRAKGRYAMAKLVKETSVQILEDLRLGELVLMMQLAANRGWFEFKGSWWKISPELPKRAAEELELTPAGCYEPKAD
ncbi:MAG: NYN domain-containing protein [Candidatus Hodarchaeales archaeon]